MRDEVEEFLRRVAQMRAQAEAQAKAAQQRPAAQQPQRGPGQPPQPGPRPQPPRPAPLQQDVVYLEPADVEVIDAELAEGERLGRRPIGSAEAMAEHARRLGSEVDLADDKLEAHIHQVFDHELGRIESKVTEAPSATRRTGYTAGSIADMLRSPESIRNAIVLGEVLRRPEERW